MSRSGNILLGTVFGAVLAAALIGGLTLVIHQSPKIDVAAVQKELAPLMEDHSGSGSGLAAAAKQSEGTSALSAAVIQGDGSVSSAGAEISISSPKTGEIWERGRSYQVRWSGGGEKVNMFLISKKIAEEVGASASVSERFYNLENKGSYDYTVPNVLTSGIYQWHVFDSSGNSFAYSDYFEIR